MGTGSSGVGISSVAKDVGTRRKRRVPRHYNINVLCSSMIDFYAHLCIIYLFHIHPFLCCDCAEAEKPVLSSLLPAAFEQGGEIV